MPIYVKCVRAGNVCYMSWQGQTQDVVVNLLSGLEASDVEFIDQATYEAAAQEN